MRKSAGSSGHTTATRHTYRMELVLEFGAPVSAANAAQVARRLTDALQVSSAVTGDLCSLDDSRIICHELRKVIKLGSDPDTSN